jgi:23S rRNA (uracil1939-C5)-methyltransferase
MLIPGQVVPLVVEKPAAGGRMIARAGGQIVLVTQAIPGERVRARIERVRKDVAFAETVAVDESSPDRREPFADPLCGGCLFSHIAYSRQLEIKSQVIADAMGRIGHITLPASVAVVASPEEGYRMRARLHHRGHRLGFFREATHDICEPRPTRQLLPATCDALDRLAAALRSLALDAVREIEIAENVDASERAISIDTTAPVDSRALEPVARTDGFSGLVSTFGTFGNSYVSDHLTLADGARVALRRHVGSFFQGNRHLLRDFVSHVVQQVPAGTELIDLYAGVGLFSVCAAVARGVHATAVEGDRVAASDLRVNAAAAGASVKAVCRPVEEFLGEAGGSAPRSSKPSSTVIVDPPRTGLSASALAGLLQTGSRRIVYVSCDVATLARDSRKILDAGYSLNRADAFDLFPNTPHIETVAVFDLIG